MNLIQIKVCGLTQIDQALVLETWGVEMLGFNFVPTSKRYLAPSQAGEIICELSPKTRCAGIFQDQSSGAIRSAIEQSGIDSLQFHGQEKPELLGEFNDYFRIKVFAIDENFDMQSIRAYENVCEAFLFDSKIANQVGGTGMTFNWNILSQIPSSKPFFVAGGIGPSNALEAIQQTKCQWLDLNSKIEQKPGIKDLNQLDLILQNLHRVGLRH